MDVYLLRVGNNVLTSSCYYLINKIDQTCCFNVTAIRRKKILEDAPFELKSQQMYTYGYKVREVGFVLG